jgi:hypothetical protein
VADVQDLVLDSPSISIQSPTAQLRFRNRYDLERNNDGGVLEVKIEGRPFFQDILDAGGSFVTGGYDAVIEANFGSPISGRLAWTGTKSLFCGDRELFRSGTEGRIALRGGWPQFGPGVHGVVDRLDRRDGRTNVNRTRQSRATTGACTVGSCDGSTGCGTCAVLRRRPGCAATPRSDCGMRHTDRRPVENNAHRNDVCSAGTCQVGRAVVPRRRRACTVDSCDRTLGARADRQLRHHRFSSLRVDGRDLAVLAKSWFSCPNMLRYNPAANLDRAQPCIDETDFHLFMNAFGRDCAP